MFDLLRKKFTVDDDKWNDYISCFERLSVPAKTVLLKEGDISKKGISNREGLQPGLLQ